MGACGPSERRVVRQENTVNPDGGGGGRGPGAGGGGGAGGAGGSAPDTSVTPPSDAGAPPRLDGATGAEVAAPPGPDAGTGQGQDRPPLPPTPDAAPPPRDQAPAIPDRSAPPTPDARTPDMATPDAAVPLSRGLVGYWKLDDATGTVARDSSGKAHQGALTNFTSADWTTGRVRGALTFDATRRTFISVANAASLNPTAGLTLAAWVNPVDWLGNRRVLQKGRVDDQYRLLAEEGLLMVALAGVTVTGNPDSLLTAPLPTAGAWHHIAATYDGATLALYVDGAQVASAAATGPVAVTADPVVIGQKSATNTTLNDGWAGRLDEVMIYDRGLTPGEIERLATGIQPL